MAGSPFEVETLQHGGMLVIRVRGELDRVSAPAVGRRLDDERRPDQDVVVVLRDVTYLDMGGIRWLEEEAQVMLEQGRRLVVAEAPALLRRVLEIVGFERTVTLLGTLEEALAHLRTDPPAEHQSGRSARSVPPDGENGK